MQKRLMTCATRQTDGKTTVTIGLTSALKKKFTNMGYIKPLGMKDVISGTVELDEDVVLLEKACGIHCNIQDMNPFLVDRKELEEYWREGRHEGLMDNIRRSFESVAEGKDLVVIEGAGHAGAGSAFGISTALLAKEFDAKVILVTSGGITHPIDEITLNLSHFMKYGVEVIGVILNKVQKEDVSRVQTFFADLLARRNVELLGLLPYEDSFARPTMMQVFERVGGKVLHGKQYMTRRIGKVYIGAARPWRVLNHFGENGLLITPGDREDLLLSMVALRNLGTPGGKSVSGIILTGGIMPHQNVLDFLRKTDIPVICTSDFSYDVAEKVNSAVPKITPMDKEMISMLEGHASEYIDIKRIIEKL